jgi:heat shock protein HslJ
MRVFFIALIALAACAASPGGPASAPPGAIHLSGTKWVRVDDANATPHNPTLEFEGARASGFAGCNRWFAAVTQNGEELRFGDVGTTRMACTAEPAAAAERSFLAALAATRYAHYDRAALVLLDANQQQVARFESMP